MDGSEEEQMRETVEEVAKCPAFKGRALNGHDTARHRTPPGNTGEMPQGQRWQVKTALVRPDV